MLYLTSWDELQTKHRPTKAMGIRFPFKLGSQLWLSHLVYASMPRSTSLWSQTVWIADSHYEPRSGSWSVDEHLGGYNIPSCGFSASWYFIVLLSEAAKNCNVSGKSLDFFTNRVSDYLFSNILRCRVLSQIKFYLYLKIYIFYIFSRFATVSITPFTSAQWANFECLPQEDLFHFNAVKIHFRVSFLCHVALWWFAVCSQGFAVVATIGSGAFSSTAKDTQ